MKQVRWGMIGCGDVTEVKSGPAFQKIAGSQLVAVMRRTGELAADYAARHRVPKWYDDADKLINDPDVNAIYIATPPDSHAEYTYRAAMAGKPIYVEKPMARNYNECVDMIRICVQANVPLFVAYYRRTLPPFVKVKQLVDDGAIGDILFVNIRLFNAPLPQDFEADNLPWRVIPRISGGGYFIDMGVHQLDFLDYVFGPINKVCGFAENRSGLYSADDYVSACFQFESGVMGNGIWSFTVPEQGVRDEIEITGTTGVLRFATFQRSPIRLITTAGEQKIDIDWPQHVHQPLLETVVAELQGIGNCPSSGRTAARTNWVVDQITREFRGQHSELFSFEKYLKTIIDN